MCSFQASTLPPAAAPQAGGGCAGACWRRTVGLILRQLLQQGRQMVKAHPLVHQLAHAPHDLQGGESRRHKDIRGMGAGSRRKGPCWAARDWSAVSRHQHGAGAARPRSQPALTGCLVLQWHTMGRIERGTRGRQGLPRWTQTR